MGSTGMRMRSHNMKRLLLILSLLCAPVFASTVITPALCKYHAILTINHAKCGSAGTVNLSNASYLLTRSEEHHV